MVKSSNCQNIGITKFEFFAETHSFGLKITIYINTHHFPLF